MKSVNPLEISDLAVRDRPTTIDLSLEKVVFLGQ